VSEENSAAVEEVSASAEEMTAQVEEVSASAQHLAGMAIELKALVGRFKLGEDPLPAIGPARSTQVHVAAVSNRRVRA
ncbi:MAG: methyl-accepting chemotaxis protein, partial [Anaerolineales bacterium]|nr:methyl-accepting chemotaxis protein [Anaerolineales bacterium]